MASWSFKFWTSRGTKGTVFHVSLQMNGSDVMNTHQQFTDPSSIESVVDAWIEASDLPNAERKDMIRRIKNCTSGYTKVEGVNNRPVCTGGRTKRYLALTGQGAYDIEVSESTTAEQVGEMLDKAGLS